MIAFLFAKIFFPYLCALLWQQDQLYLHRHTHSHRHTYTQIYLPLTKQQGCLNFPFDRVTTRGFSVIRTQWNAFLIWFFSQIYILWLWAIYLLTIFITDTFAMCQTLHHVFISNLSHDKTNWQKKLKSKMANSGSQFQGNSPQG